MSEQLLTQPLRTGVDPSPTNQRATMTTTFHRGLGILILAVIAAVPVTASASGPFGGSGGIPVLTRETIAVIARSRKAVAAYSPTLGKWTRVELEEPLEPNASLTVGNGFAVFQTSKGVYAYSAATGVWGQLPISKPVKNQFAIHEQMVVVTDGDSLCVFGRNATEWSVVKLESGEITRP